MLSVEVAHMVGVLSRVPGNEGAHLRVFLDVCNAASGLPHRATSVLGEQGRDPELITGGERRICSGMANAQTLRAPACQMRPMVIAVARSLVHGSLDVC